MRQYVNVHSVSGENREAVPDVAELIEEADESDE